MAAGCTPQIQKSIDEFKLSDYVHSYTVLSKKERLLENAFKLEHVFIREEEMIAQDSLTNDAEGLVTTWVNATYGEIVFHPGQYSRQGNRKCRNYKIVYIITGRGIFEHNETGQSCFNTVSSMWEWVD